MSHFAVQTCKQKVKIECCSKVLKASSCFAEKSFYFKAAGYQSKLEDIPCKILCRRCIPYFCMAAEA